jgi:glycosyltransferase involved in cell wall biosynthesis
MKQQPTVSVCMITYGHEKFIEQAINGVLMQECDFEVELIIANDSSPDQTDDIIQNILENHPRAAWIKYIKQEKNIGMMPNFIFAMKKCESEYIALCEGDDFWTDPLKLQKQVDFLEANPEYVMSGHDAYVVNEKGTQIRDSIFCNFHKIDYTKEQLINSPFLMPLTMCFRNVIKEFPKEFLKVKNGDVFLISVLGQYGMSKFQEDIIPASYRVHSGGVSSMVSELEKEYQRKNTFCQLFCYYQRINDRNDTAYHFFINYKKTILRLMKVSLQERHITVSFKLYLEFLMKCIKYSLWKECAYITADYFKLVKKQLVK